MKLFRNPWVAGGLALAAVLVVLYVVFLPQWQARHRGSVSGASVVAADAAAGSASVVAPPPKTVPPPAAEIDLAYAQAHFQEWIDAPPRDPFLLNLVVAPPSKQTPQQISPVVMMKLKAIWRQTGASFAAIDHGLYREGDEIVAGYKLERIERDQVWIQGPEKQERLDFDKHFTLVETPRGTNFVERFLGPEQQDPLRPKL